MIHVELKNKQYRKFFESDNGFVTGTAFTKNGKMLSGEALKDYLVSFETPEDLVQNLPDLNGFNAFAFKKGGHLIAAVDRIRSLPLFYGVRDGNLYISDEAKWVRDQLGDQEIDPLAKDEFLLTGYVTGPDTLFPNVKQIQAGEVVFFSQGEDGKVWVEPQRYYRYLHSNYYMETEEELHRMFDDALQNVFKRLITYADGHTIVVPLSGGYDSRLIVLMLKRLGYENVIAFSYGRPGNEEAEISRFVAEKLGIRWEFVPYSNDLWYEWYRSPEMKGYFEFADNLASLPHIQDWPAVKVLKQEKRITDDAIFVPGHSADLPAGSRSKSVPDLYRGEVSSARLLESIKSYHYSLFDWPKKNQRLSPNFEQKILSVLGDLDQYPDQSSAFESWDISERQPKFIVNSLRVYEFFGYEWWIPFWDKEFMDYWCRISPAKRLNQSFYIKFVNNLAKQLRLEEPLWNAGGRTPVQKCLISTAKKILPESLKKWLQKKRNIHSFKNNPMGWYGIHGEGFIKEQIQNGATMINSILASDYIDGFQESSCRD